MPLYLRRSVADRAFRDLQSGVASLNPGFEHPDFPNVLQDQLKAHRYSRVKRMSYNGTRWI